MPMPEQSFSVRVEINARDFRGFAFFDVFVRLRRWVPLAVFAGLLSFFSLICFLMWKRDGAVLLGGALLVIGVGLPVAHVRQFFVSIHRQAKNLGLNKPQYVYTLNITPGGLTVHPAGTDEPLVCEWPAAFGAFRRKNAVYLYINPRKAYIIPNDLVSGPDDLWNLLVSVMPLARSYYNVS